MSRRTFGVLLVLALVLLLPACKLPERSISQAGAAPNEALVAADKIPAAWGNLVAVSSVAEYPDLVQMWFQDDQKNVRMVVFQVPTGQLVNAKLLRRS